MRGHAGKMFDVEAQNKSTPPLVGPSLLPFLGTCSLDTLIKLISTCCQKPVRSGSLNALIHTITVPHFDVQDLMGM